MVIVSNGWLSCSLNGVVEYSKYYCDGALDVAQRECVFQLESICISVFVSRYFLSSNIIADFMTTAIYIWEKTVNAVQIDHQTHWNFITPYEPIMALCAMA